MPDKVNYKDFSAKIKAKYPEYNDIDDSTLATKMVEKYPDYKDVVDFSTVEKKSPTQSTDGGNVSNTPAQPSTKVGGNTGSNFSSFDPYAGTEINADNTSINRVNITKDQAFKNEGVKAKAKEEAKSLALYKEVASPDHLFKNAVNSFGQGFLKTASGIPKAIAIGAKHLGEDRELKDMATYQAGKWMDETAESLFPTDKNLQKDFVTGKLPATMGNAAGYMAGGAVGGGGAVALLGGTQNMSDEYHAALQATGDEDLAFKTSLKAFAIGTLEAAPVASFFSKLDKATGGMVNKQIKTGVFGELAKKYQAIENTKVGGTVLGGVEEMAQESTTQILNNLNAQQSYDATRKLTDGLGESAGMGMGFGLVMNGFRKSLEIKRDQAATPEEKARIDEAIALTQPKEEGVEVDLSKGFNPDKAAEIINQGVDQHITETTETANATEQPIDPATSQPTVEPGIEEQGSTGPVVEIQPSLEANTQDIGLPTQALPIETTKGAVADDSNDQVQQGEVGLDTVPVATEGQSVNTESMFPKGDVPIQEMTSEQLYDHGKRVKEYNKNLEVEFFGSDGAKKYKQAQLKYNSLTASREQIQEADKIIKEMEGSLSESQRNEFFGIGQDADNLYNEEQINDLAQKVKFIEDAENMNDIARSLKLPLLEFSKSAENPSVESVTLINVAKKKALELGIDPLALIKTSLENISNDLPDKADAAFLAKTILEKLLKPGSEPQQKSIEQGTSLGLQQPDSVADVPVQPGTVGEVADKPKNIKSTYANAIKRADLPEETKQILEDNLYYDTFSNKEANTIADALIEEAGGVEEALKLFNEDAKLPSSVKVKLYIKGINQTTDTYSKATDDTEKKEIIERQADLMEQLETITRDAGRLIESLKELYKALPEAIVIKKKRELKKLNDDISSLNVSDSDIAAIKDQLATEVAKSTELQKEIADLQKQLKNKKNTVKKEQAKKLISEGLDELVSMIGAKKNFVPDYESKDFKRAVKKIFKGLAIELELAGDELVAKVKDLLIANGMSDDGLDDALEDNRPDKINIAKIVKAALEKQGAKRIDKDPKKQNELHQAVLAEVSELDIPEDRKKVLADKITKVLKEKTQKVVEAHLKKKYAKDGESIKIEKSARKLAEDINNGVLDKKELQEGFAQALGKIDLNDPKITDKLTTLANNIANAGTDITRFKAELAMAEYMKVLTKANFLESYIGLLYGNMLLSIGSPLTNVAFGLQVVAKEYIYNAAALLKSGLTGDAATYHKSLAIFSAMANAATGKGSVLARDILRTGSALETSNESPQSDALINNQKEIKTTLDWALDKYMKGMSMAFRNLKAGDAYLSTVIQSKLEFDAVFDQAAAAEALKVSENVFYPVKSQKQIAKEVLRLFDGKIRQNTEFGKAAATEIEKSQSLTEPLLIEKDGKTAYSPIYKDKKYNDIKRLHALAAYEMQEKARGLSTESKDAVTQERMEEMLMAEPKGDAGVLYKALSGFFDNYKLGKLIAMPFLKVAINATNQMIERSPIGTAVYLPKYITAVASQGKVNPEMRAGLFSGSDTLKKNGLDPVLTQKTKSRILRRQLLGMATTATIYGLTQIEFDEEDEKGKKTGKKIPLIRVNGRGYHNWSENNNLRYADPDFDEYSVVIYNPTTKKTSNVKYKTSVLAGPLLVLGILDDYARYGKQSDEETMNTALKAVTISLAYGEFVGEASSMKGMADLIKGIQDLGNDVKETSKMERWQDGIGKFVAKKVGSFLPIPLRASKELDQIYRNILDAPATQATEWYEYAMKDVPYLNEMLHYKFDHLGRPVETVKDVPMLFNDQYKERELYKTSQKYLYNFKFMDDRAITDSETALEIPLSASELRELNLLAGKELDKTLFTPVDGSILLHDIDKDASSQKGEVSPNDYYKSVMDAHIAAARALAKLAINEKLNKKKP